MGSRSGSISCLTTICAIRSLTVGTPKIRWPPLFLGMETASGWIEYYGRYAPSALSPMLRYVNLTLLRWAMRKFKRFKAHKIRASHFLQRLARDKMSLFVHWRIGMTGTFA